MNPPAIRLDAVAKSFGPHAVLRGVSLEIPEGRTLALLGRNGAGKTTMIRILLGLIPADSGSVRVAGFDPAEAPEVLRSRIGFLAEDQAMYGWMTPAELCRFLAPFYPTWDDACAASYLRRLEIPADVRISRLSKGQSVKLGLAVALAHHPRIVVLDDPALGLDPIARKEFNRDLVDHLQPAGCTVLYSSHLLGEVEAVADDVAILDEGRILRAGSTDALREEVRRILLPAAAVAGLPGPDGLLDCRRHGDRLALVVDRPAPFLHALARRGADFEDRGLSLDEIFEAFVIGRKNDWPGTDGSVPAMAA